MEVRSSCGGNEKRVQATTAILFEYPEDKLLAVLLKTFFTESKTRISSEALALSSDLIELFIEESLARTASEAKKVGRSEAVIEDFESILIQLTLDFAG
ncbi:Centromere protein X [Sparganum proliferum]